MGLVFFGVYLDGTVDGLFCFFESVEFHEGDASVGVGLVVHGICCDSLSEEIQSSRKIAFTFLNISQF